MYKTLITIGISTLILSACQNFTATDSQPTYSTIPSVSPKYDDQSRQSFDSRRKQGTTNRYEGLTINTNNLLKKPGNLPQSLFYDSGIDIPYPQDGVKGIYLPIASITDPSTLDAAISKLDNTALNAVVLDFKDDGGQILPTLQSDNPLIAENSVGLIDYKPLLQEFEEKGIYPIARIVTFKDMMLADARPDLSFRDASGDLWSPDGDYYTNPYLKEVWDYNIAVAIEAAKMGFKDIQFDYVRFSYAFVYEQDSLTFDKGEFANYVKEDPEDLGEENVAAITQFLAYAREKLAPYGVNVSADVFGSVAVAPNDFGSRGIGQHFYSIAENVDVVSSMIYPSHWSAGSFNIDNPNGEPYRLIDEYMLSETMILNEVSNPVVTRPWLQNFPWENEFGYTAYNDEEIQAQIDALSDHGVYEYLLWNVSGDYSQEYVDYAPEKSQEE